MANFTSIWTAVIKMADSDNAATDVGAGILFPTGGHAQQLVVPYDSATLLPGRDPQNRMSPT